MGVRWWSVGSLGSVWHQILNNYGKRRKSRRYYNSHIFLTKSGVGHAKMSIILHTILLPKNMSCIVTTICGILHDFMPKSIAFGGAFGGPGCSKWELKLIVEGCQNRGRCAIQGSPNLPLWCLMLHVGQLGSCWNARGCDFR